MNASSEQANPPMQNYASDDRSFFGHPRGLRTLFFVELWERFSYYGMRALLILFMTAPLASGGLAWPTGKAGPIYGMYTSLVYLMSLPGGWIADRLIGQRRAVFIGGVVIMCGHIVLAIPSVNTFYVGLGLVIVGTGLLKPNISTIVGQIYSPEDSRRDAGFSIFYMGINAGALLAPLVTASLAQEQWFKDYLTSWGMSPASSWHWGFGATAVGMFFGLVWYVVDQKSLGDAGKHPVVSSEAEATRLRTTFFKGIGLVAVVLATLAVLQMTGLAELTAQRVSSAFGRLLLVTVGAFFAWLFLQRGWTAEERKRLVVIAVLFLGASVFWSVFEQAGSTLSLFAEGSTRNEIFGKSFGSGKWQSVNSAWVVLLAPVFAVLWVKLGNLNPSHAAKFAMGLLFVSLGFGLMVPAAQLAANGNRVGWWWLLGCYFLHTVGEMCLSPVGLSAMTKLAPARVGSLMMGVWFMATSVGSFLGGQVAGAYERFSLPRLFGVVALYALVFAGVLALLVKPIKRMLASTPVASSGTAPSTTSDMPFSIGAAGIPFFWLLFHGRIAVALGLIPVIFGIRMLSVFGGSIGAGIGLIIALGISLGIGARGSKIAWEHRKYQSLEELNRGERGWNVVGAVLLTLQVLAFVWFGVG
jgi:POT family proton-dependent oligopeptide transporter